MANDKKSATVTIGSSNVTVSATLQTISGTCGTGLTWSLAQDGSGNYTRLTISGSGAMTNYNNDGASTWHTTAPWGYGLTSVTIADGVTTIGNYAFCGCQNLATVTLPASVTSLNQGAFYNCSGLERIDIQHDGAVSLGSNVFQNCGALQYIVFPSIAAEQANTTGNWSGLAEKRRAKFGNQHFGVTKDATNTAVYAIATAADLRNLAAAVNAGNNGSGKTFLQTADIDLGGSSNPFTPIGYNKYFYGTYDGGSHTISGLYVNAGNDNSIGFFGRVSNGTVRNVILISPDITNTYNQGSDIRVGALIGYAYVATVENSFVVSPTVNATGNYGTKYIGALIGETSYSTRVTNCSFYAGTGNASNGIGNRGSSTNGDGSRAYKVTLGSNAGLPDPPATGGFIAQGSHYYAQGATAQLSYTGSIPNGYRPVFTVSPDNTGATVTQQVVLTMGSADITITASLSSTPLIDISTGTIADIPDQDYTGSAIVPDITLTVGGQLLTEGTDYLVSCTNNVNLGTATLTATGMGDYTGTLTKDFRICYADKTGSCGNGVTYTLHDEDQNGHYEQLTISGTGAMTDYASQDDVPWAAKCDDINSVTVQSGVTSIGARAFDWCRYLTSVSLPEGLTSIGEGAFRYCQSLPSLTVPASVESVGIEAFKCLAYDISGCTLTFASGSRLTSVGRDAFYFAKASVDMSTCTSLTSVPNAFQYFDGNVTFPRSLTSIAKWCFNHGESTTKVYIDVPDNYLLTVNNESVSATDGKADITSNIGVGTSHSAVTLSCIPNPAHFSQSGDEYTIHTATGWNIFCDILNDYPKGYFTGKTVRLGDNISVTRMAGSSNHNFTGTFDGNKKTLTVNYSGSSYVAPFPYVDGATIQDLVVEGTISSSGTRAAGVIGETGTTISHITNCVSSSTISGGNFSGGFSIGGNVEIEGCVFNGTIDSDGNSGGFVGYSQGALTITNSLFAPQSGSSAKGTFYYNGTAGTLTNCYYTAPPSGGWGAAQGKAPCPAPAAPVGSATHAKYDVSDITPYANGILRTLGDATTFYYGGGDIVSAPYVDENGDNASHAATALSPDHMPATLDANYDSDNDGYLDQAWYYVADNIAYTQTVALDDGTRLTLVDVTLILADGKTMSVMPTTKGEGIYGHISQGEGPSLIIYGQPSQSGTIAITTSGEDEPSGNYIIVGNAISVKDYAQHGGIVTIKTSGELACGIEALGTATITRGTLNVNVAATKSDAIFGNVTFSGGNLTATSTATSPYYGINGNITLSWTSADDRITVSSYSGSGTIADGQSFYNGSEVISSGTVTDKSKLNGKTLIGVDVLEDAAANDVAALATSLGGKQTNIALNGRTLYQDGAWNTLCLPFDVTLADSPLSGAIARTLTNASFEDGTLNLTFGDNVTELSAGTPYLIMWEPADLIIKDKRDWNDFAAAVSNGSNTFANKVVRLAADIDDVSMVAGSSSFSFFGTFDGDGHTLTLDLNSMYTDEYCAPFYCVNGATIKNLHTAGTVSAGIRKYGAGLVGSSKGTVNIKNCRSSVTISSNRSSSILTDKDGTHGGFVGVVNDGSVTMTNCLFDGEIKDDTNATTNCGGFIGWHGDDYPVTFENCLMAGTLNINVDENSATFTRNGYMNTDINNCYYTTALGNGGVNQGTAVGGRTDATLANDLGSGWQVTTGGVVPANVKVVLADPMFAGVKISDAVNNKSFDLGGGRSITFKGTYDKVSYGEDTPSILFLGASNTLYYPQNGATIGACRAYFELEGLSVGDVSRTRMFFGDGSEDTGIISVSKESGNQGNNPEFLNSIDYYTLDGVKLDGKPTKKGLYIHGGKKVLVRDKR